MIYLIITLLFSVISYAYLAKLPISGNILHIRFSKNSNVLVALITGLFFSQMVMYRPGSNISPYAYSHGLLEQILVLGKTVSNWMSLALVGYCVFRIIIGSQKFKLGKNFIIMYSCVLLTILTGVVQSNSLVSGLSEGVKYLLPFLIFGAIMSLNCLKIGPFITKLLTYTNVIMIIQVLLCKVFTGKFAASTYYWEFQEEYFGFYNHPHNFTGLLGILTIWCIFNINRKNHSFFYILLAMINIGLMYISGSRSYVYSLIISIGYILLVSLFDSKLKRMRKYAITLFTLMFFFGGAFISNLGSNRVTGDVLSGRGLRWLTDIQYYLTSTTLAQKFLGGGFGFVNEVNLKLSGVYINSLNIFIDVLLNNGLIGLFLLIIAYGILFSYFVKEGSKQFSITIVLFFVISSVVTNFITYQVVLIYMVLVLHAIMYMSKIERQKLPKIMEHRVYRNYIA